jgi:hypothetical protein
MYCKLYNNTQKYHTEEILDVAKKGDYSTAQDAVDSLGLGVAKYPAWGCMLASSFFLKFPFFLPANRN